MYSPVRIEQLSKAQISKLLNGHGVRVKHHASGRHMVHLSSAQHKKLASAHKKGKAVTLQFDPYQIAHHQHLRGEGIMSSIKKVAKHVAHKAIPIASKFIREEAHKLRKPAEKMVEGALQPYFGEPLSHEIAVYGSTKGYEAFDKGLSHGEHLAHQAVGGSLKSIGRKIVKGLSKATVGLSKASKPLAGIALDTGLAGLAMVAPETAIAAPALSYAGHQAIEKGMGVKKAHHKKRGRPSKGGALVHPRSMHYAGGALYPSGY
jgi:hypothetical protein